MSNEALAMVQLTREGRRLIDNISPWIDIQEMATRYSCTTRNLANMEKRGEIPYRTRGRWLRSEVLEWEMNLLRKN